MGSYRAQVRHVKYWRGAIQRWSTSYLLNGSLTAPLSTAAAQTLMLADDKMCYGNTAADGGTYECSIYNLATGGVPVATYTAFDWTNPAVWVKYGGSAWGASAGFMQTPAEAALLVEWPGGLSATGKPVRFKKWYHACPSVSPGGGAVDISPTVITSLTSGAANVQSCLFSGYGLGMGTPSRSAGSPLVSAYYANHQMPRGRRRRTTTSDLSKLKSILSDFTGVSVDE